MPKHDGYWLLDRLRTTPGCEGIRAVALSGLASNTDKERSLAWGFHAHLVKPVSAEDLQAALSGGT